MTKDKWPNLRLMIRERKFYSLESAEAELTRALEILDNLAPDDETS